MDSAVYDQVVRELKQDEAIRRFPYDDKTGKAPMLAMRTRQGQIVPTYGKLTIGVGWNLTDNGLPDQVIDFLLDLGIKNGERAAFRLFPGFYQFTPNRQAALTNALFNLGETRFLEFKRTIKAIRAAQWADAASHMLDSKWAKQVGPTRSGRIADQLRNG